MKKLYTIIAIVALACVLLPLRVSAIGYVVPTDTNQVELMKAYKMALYEATYDYRFGPQNIDTTIYPLWGEYSVLWGASGANKGCFINPEIIPGEFTAITKTQYDEPLDWQANNYYSIQYKASSKLVAIFRSSLQQNNGSVSWEYMFFKDVFDTYLYNNIYYLLNEIEIDTMPINSSTQILIIPSFSANEEDNKYFIDSIFTLCPNLKTNLDAFLARGGMIYTEGNAAYFIEKLGYMPTGAIDFENVYEPDTTNSCVNVTFTGADNPVSFTERSVRGKLYSASIPTVTAPNAQVIAQIEGSNAPVVFAFKGATANGGKILCNLGLPTVGGLSDGGGNSNRIRQLSWPLNAIFWAWAEKIDVVRNVWNDIPDSVTANNNAVSYNAVDTFEVKLTVRNLYNYTINNINLKEYLRTVKVNNAWVPYFTFVDVLTPGVDYTINGATLSFNDISLAPHSELIIRYRLSTPEPNAPVHSVVNSIISWSNYAYVSYGVFNYDAGDGVESFLKYRNYIDFMFSAEIAADADLNWKNFLGLYYQPFKVFMIMENKERTAAMETKYIQYIPKDVPFYWVDNSINIPILKTPGGKFVDVLRGSNSEESPEFDMDSDGKPDAWLDTASIYPKGYTIEEDMVYWLNPWEHLKTGNRFLYEDIDHDGLRAEDTDGDGIVDIEEPGDKIRVWKVTWNIGKVAGYEYFDPYCSFEIWVDPPDLVKMAAGVGYAYGLCEATDGMFYPYSPDIDNPNLADTTWKHWCERDTDGSMLWKQLIYQSISNYEGFTFIDTAAENYTLLGTDYCAGTGPQPRRVCIAALSLGGEEIDMTHVRPQQSLYSKVEYKSIFNEKKSTPIRTTYTYYAPLPNPLQFEYLSNCFLARDYYTGDTLKYLPKYGKAWLSFDVDASTEYTYYWIRNVGHDVDYNDPSLAAEGDESLGDGVFGYMIYDIPKGVGGYQITLPKNTDGSYNIDALVTVDGAPFTKWLDNPNTKDSVEIWEDQFQYHIYIPQLLIPPALDDNNGDGIDDWRDDRGDRFCSATGFLHDRFMLDNGEQWLDYPLVPFQDDIYGWVDSGWYCGPDNTYGDDFFEKLGKTQFRFNVLYEGKGREGSVDISKGGWLVVEEIFGGSPWVIFSHTLSGFAKGTDYAITSTASPGTVKYGTDTIYLKHVVEDKDEPHYFDSNFDPYHISFGYGKSAFTTYAGGKDPCSLIEPPIDFSTIMDMDYNQNTITLIPYADQSNPIFAGYPRTETGVFLEVRVEAMNGTDYNWINTCVKPVLPPELLNSEIIMKYVAYPRPLVPAMVDPVTGEVIQGGDDVGSFRAGWRFNQPEGEVLMKLSDTLPLLQPGRRAYFIYLLKLDESLAKGIYSFDFDISGDMRYYTGVSVGDITYEVPPVMFSVDNRNESGTVMNYLPLIIGEGSLQNIVSQLTPQMRGMQNVRWSTRDVTFADFDTLPNSLPAVYNPTDNTETINMSQFEPFPTTSTTKLFILEQGEVSSYGIGDDVYVTQSEKLNYTNESDVEKTITKDPIKVMTSGPKINVTKEIIEVNGEKVNQNNIKLTKKEPVRDVLVRIEATNFGNNIAENLVLSIAPGQNFVPDGNLLPQNCTLDELTVNASLVNVVPGETRSVELHYKPINTVCAAVYNKTDVIGSIGIQYLGYRSSGSSQTLFAYKDQSRLDCRVSDLFLNSLTLNIDKPVVEDSVILTAGLINGIINIKEAEVAFYAVLNRTDTIPVSVVKLNDIENGAEMKAEAGFKIPDSAIIIDFYATVKPIGDVCEFCLSNNELSLSPELKGPGWISNVVLSPSPVEYRCEFSYILPREMSNVELTIYSLSGEKVALIPNCPRDMGKHELIWNAVKMPKGTYIFIFKGINAAGGEEKYVGKLIKS